MALLIDLLAHELYWRKLARAESRKTAYVAVRRPRVRDREAGVDDQTRIRFTPAILPPYARRSRNLDTLMPILRLPGPTASILRRV
jgi:hypothetical protein